MEPARRRTLEVGETPAEGLASEMKEETGLDVGVGPVVEVFDRITRDEQGRVRFHYVLVDYLCTVRGGTPVAGSDVAEVVLVGPDDLGRYDLTPKSLVAAHAEALRAEVVWYAAPRQTVQDTAHLRFSIPRRFPQADREAVASQGAGDAACCDGGRCRSPGSPGARALARARGLPATR